MSPNNFVSEAAIDSGRGSDASVNAELASIMKESIGDPVFKFTHHGENLAEVLANKLDPRVVALREAMLVAVHAYASNMNSLVNPSETEASKSQLDRFNLNCATRIYGPVYVKLYNALRALQQPGMDVELQPRVRVMVKTLEEKAKEGKFSSELLAQAAVAAKIHHWQEATMA